MTHRHSHGPFDPDDPLTGLGIAMVGMALQEAAEEEERQRRARLTPWQRAEEDRRSKELAGAAPWIALIILFLFLLFLCSLPHSAMVGY
jgi:hypothetical protein